MATLLPQDSRILIVKLADIGDTLLATPALRLLRQSYPKAHMAALVAPHSAEILRGSTLVDELITFDQHRYDSLASGLRPRAAVAVARELAALREKRFDSLILMHHLITRWGVAKHAALCLASGATRRIGLDDGRGFFLTERVPDAGFGHRHEAEYCVSLARVASAEGQVGRLEFPVGPSDQGYAEAILRAIPRPRIVVHAGSGGYSLARRWSPEGFARVADSLAEEFGASIILVGGGQEVELAARVGRSMRSSVLDLTGQTSLRQLAAILGESDLLVGNDSGVAHVGVAVGTRVVAIFGPSNHLAWGPYDPTIPESQGMGRRRVVRVNLPCSPCMYRDQSLGLRHGCETKDCLRLVTPEMVVEQARVALTR